MAYESNSGRPAIKPPRTQASAAPAIEDVAVSNSAPAQSSASADLDAVLNLLNDIAVRQASLERRLEARLAPRQPTRQEARKKTIAANVIGRNGERLTRRHDDSTNPFELPEEFVEITRAEGYSLEWKTEIVLGQDKRTYQAKLHANGWRPVPSSRLPGMYASEDDEGPVRYDGMVLMERPMSLTREAREEDAKKAYEQVRMKHDSWGVDSKNTDVFDPNTPMAKSYTISPRSAVEPTDPSWQPTLEIAGEEV